MSQPETTTDDETYTVEDLVINLALVQDFKLLHLQTASFNDRDVLITNIVNKNSLLRTIQKYRAHFSSIEITQDSIVINRLSKLSFLRAGLKKETLRLIEHYF